MKQTLILLAATLVWISCSKPPTEDIAGKGGQAALVVYPQHHEVAKDLINIKIYIKYNTQDAPANGVYDDSVGGINQGGKVSGTFAGLTNGKYYVYGYGYDTAVKQFVKGGLPHTITAQVAQDFVLPVSED